MEQQQPATVFEWLGGEAGIQTLVMRFYDLMDLEPGYAELRAAHGSDLGQARQKGRRCFKGNGARHRGVFGYPGNPSQILDKPDG